MTIVKELKTLAGFGGALRGVTDIFNRPLKVLQEAVGMGLPSWDPPPVVPARPPDVETAAKVKEMMGMGTLQEKQTFDQVMLGWRQIRDGQPRQPARVEPIPPPALPPPRQQEAPREAP